MRHNNMVLDHPKSTRIFQVDGLLTGPPDLGRHKNYNRLSFVSSFFSIISLFFYGFLYSNIINQERKFKSSLVFY